MFVLLGPVNFLIFRRILPRRARAAGADVGERPSRATLRRYLAGDYAGQVAGQFSSTLLPVLVAGLLGPEQTGYFLPAQTIFAAMGLLSRRSPRHWSSRRRPTRSAPPSTPSRCCAGSACWCCAGSRSGRRVPGWGCRGREQAAGSRHPARARRLPGRPPRSAPGRGPVPTLTPAP